ncbi:MAG: ComEC/Rec2 family competence protein, partial [Sulfurimonas sp.]
HLGILSGVLFLLLKFPYRLLQNRYFPYRNIKRDLMILIAFTLLVYTLFLDSPPSLLRAFVMLVIGFILYDRGVKIISMQTLLLTVMLILAFFPRLFFSIGLWLSVAGVFFIFLFLLYFQDKKPVWNFILLPIFVYIMMLPFSLAIFGNFSLLHPLSIIYTTLFTLFYPLSFLLHLLGYGALLDPLLHSLLLSGKNGVEIEIDYKVLGAFIAIALGSIFSKRLFMLLSLFAFSIFIYAVNYVT